jgi:hypothetical protein
MDPSIHPIQRNWGARIRDVVYHGMRLVILENERLRIGVLAGKGTDIIELNYKPLDLDFAWLTPGGVQDPTSYLSTSPDPLAAFLDNYPGGWQEILPNGGAPSRYGGAQFGQHGEVFALPWDVAIVEDAEDAVAVRFSVRTRKTPFLLEKTIHLVSGEAGFRLDERLTNESPVTMRAMWGHHITFGQPFLRPGCRIRLPAGVTAIPHPDDVAPGGRRIADTEPFAWPNARNPAGDALDLGLLPERGAPGDLVYLTGFPDEQAWYEIRDEDRGVGSRIEWDARHMPYLWYWQEFGAHTAYPWYGRNYNIGLEPFSSFPTNGLAEAVENDSALHMESGEARYFWLTMSVLDDGSQSTAPGS